MKVSPQWLPAGLILVAAVIFYVRDALTVRQLEADWSAGALVRWESGIKILRPNRTFPPSLEAGQLKMAKSFSLNCRIELRKSRQDC